MAFDVKMTNDLAKQIPAETMVSPFQHYAETEFLFLFIGVCQETSNTTIHCTCLPGWTGMFCERQVNYCANVTCLNNGVCRSSGSSYTCECLGDNYSGRFCEVTAGKATMHRVVAKSFAFVAIIAITAFAMIIIVMDVLKYCFGINIASADVLSLSSTKKATHHTRIRFVYVPFPKEVQVTPSL